MKHYLDVPKRVEAGLAVSKSGVNFINILQAHFLYESALHSFSLVTFWLYNFGAKFFYKNVRIKR